MSNERGFFEIGIYRGKSKENVGTLWRSAYQLGASGIFTIGRRYPLQSSDTCGAHKHIPMREYQDIDSFIGALPFGCHIVAVEMGGTSLDKFHHPESAIYLLGAEDVGIQEHVLSRAHHVVSIPSLRSESYNVAVAGSIVMYDRMVKRGVHA